MPKVMRRKKTTMSHKDWKSVLTEKELVSEKLTGSIPRIMHHIFFPGEQALTPEVEKNVKKIRELNPDWEYRFYDQKKSEDFILSYYGKQMLETFLKIHPDYYAARSDLLRYLICYAHGGIYMDIKSGIEKPFDSILKPDDTYILSQWDEIKNLDPRTTKHPSAHPELRHIKGFAYVQWFLVSAPRHPFLEAVIDEVLLRIEQYNPLKDGVGRLGVLRITGPIAYTLAIHSVIAQAPHRFASFGDDLGFIFSVYGDHKTHRSEMGKHYSINTQPVIETSALIEFVSNIYFSFLLLQWARIRRKFRAIFGR